MVKLKNKLLIFVTLALSQCHARIYNNDVTETAFANGADAVYINSAAAGTDKVSSTGCYTRSIFDSDDNTFYLANFGQGGGPAGVDQRVMKATFNGSVISVSSLATDLGTDYTHVRRMDIIKDNEGGKHLVWCKEDHGTFDDFSGNPAFLTGVGNVNVYGVSTDITAGSASVPKLFSVKLDGKSAASELADVKDVDNNSAIIDNICVFGENLNKLAVVAVKNGNPNNLLTTDTKHRLKVYEFSTGGTWQETAVGKSQRPGTPGTYDDSYLGYAASSDNGSLRTVLGDPDVRSVRSMHWNKELNRLYLGFLSTSGDTDRKLFIAVGRVADIAAAGSYTGVSADNLLIDSILSHGSSTANFDAAVDSDSAISLADGNGQECSVEHIASTKTSTGKHYLVYHLRLGMDGDQPEARKIYALPLNESTTASAANTAEIEKGRILQNDFSAVATRSSQVFRADSIQALVGGAPLPADDDLDITDLQVCGDTVFACVIGGTDGASANDALSHLAGVYASSAIFDENGWIAAWTPWTRVITSGEAAFSGEDDLKNTAIYRLGIDKINGRFYYVFGNSLDNLSEPVNGVGVTSWSAGNNLGNPYSFKNLLSKINTDFSKSQTGGIWSAYHFPCTKVAGLGNSSLSVVSGFNKLALFSTGGLLSGTPYSNNLSSDSIMPFKKRPYATVSWRNADFADAEINKHYHLFNSFGNGLNVVLCAEAGRITGAFGPIIPTPPAGDPQGFPDRHGFLFIGGGNTSTGRGGVSVLRKSDGSGWNARLDDPNIGKDLQNMNDGNGNMNTYSFKRIAENIITDPVHDLVSTGEFLYVMTAKAVYRIRLHKNGGDSMGTLTSPLGIDAPTMFADSADPAVDATATPDLQAAGAAAGGLIDADGNQYKNSLVVVQKVLDFNESNSTSSFVNMVGIPNSNVIFVASIDSATQSTIRTIRDANSADLAAITGAINTTSVPYVVRRMHLVMGNTFNGELADSFGTVLTSGYSGTIGNLYVLTGSVFDKNTKVYRYAIKGGFVAADIFGNVVNSISYTETTLQSNPGHLVASTSNPVASGIGILANDMNFNALPYIFAHSGDNADGLRTNDHLLHWDKLGTTLENGVRPLDIGSGSNEYVFGLHHFDVGAMMMFGSFGARVQE